MKVRNRLFSRILEAFNGLAYNFVRLRFKDLTLEACLKELDLLEPAQARFKLPTGEQASLAGFNTVSREKLKALSGDKLSEMAATDELELCYVHLQSLNCLTPMAERQIGAAPDRQGCRW